MPKFEPVLLANIGKPDSHTLRGVRSDRRLSGAAARCWQEMTPAHVIETGQSRANLRGRGGAGFPTGLKWTFLPKDHPGPIYMCINADESEPGTFNNRILMEDDPHQVLEGIILSCFATQGHARPTSTCGTSIRCRGDRLQAAIDECYASRLSGQEHSGQRLLARHLPAPRRGGVHLRRRDRADRKPRRQAGLAADQAAVSGRRRRCSASRRS